MNNILLHRISDVLMTGLLIDFDYSKFIDFDKDTATLATDNCGPSSFISNANSDDSVVSRPHFTNSDDSMASRPHFANSGIQRVSTASLVIYLYH